MNVIWWARCLILVHSSQHLLPRSRKLRFREGFSARVQQVYGAGAWLSFGLSLPTSPRCCCALNPGFLHAAVSSPVL